MVECEFKVSQSIWYTSFLDSGISLSFRWWKENPFHVLLNTIVIFKNLDFEWSLLSVWQLNVYSLASVVRQLFISVISGMFF